MRAPTPWDLPERFRSKIAVDADTGCWLWTATRMPQGYGRVKRDGRLDMAYRVVYELAFAEIPDGLHLDHLCRTPRCVHPLHLEPVTHIENMRRRADEIRSFPFFQCGHDRTPANTHVQVHSKRAEGNNTHTCLTCWDESQARHGLKRNAERRAQRAATREQVAA